MYPKNLKLTFFDSVAIANREKIHSQIFEWLFSSPEFSNEIKTGILVDLFELDKNHITFKQIYCMTEYKSIDFILRADDELFVIENKLKSFQHDNQLKRYENVIDEDEDLLCNNLQHNDDKVHLILLSVIKEPSKSDNWKEKTYSDLVDILNKFLPKMDKEVKGFSKNILKEYLNSWKNTLTAMEAFLAEHEKYPNVFKKSNKSDNYMRKFKGLYTNPIEEYIKMGNYETIFEMALLDKIAQKMNIGNEYGYQIEVSDRSGEALIQFTVKVFSDKNNNQYVLGIQFQRNTIKLNYRHLSIENYKKSSKENIPRCISDIFKKIAKNNKGFSVRNGTHHEYCCMSFSLQKNYFENHSFEDIAYIFKEKYLLMEKFIEECYAVINEDSDWHNH